jgi:hypothetical protein
MTSESCQGGGQEKGSWKFSKFAHSNGRSIKIEHEIDRSNKVDEM